MSTEMQYQITVVVAGQNLGTWDKMTGGDATAPSAKHRPGGMVPEKSYRTLPTYADCVVNRVLERERDWENTRWLKNLAGSARMTIVRQPLDDNGNAWGNPETFAGRLGSVKGGQSDSTSTSPTMVELTMYCETRS